uniref:Uncharacterized protein n=3 Tax=Macaca TaxID=9539 RepID=A0A5F7ZW01_MACMU
ITPYRGRDSDWGSPSSWASVSPTVKSRHRPHRTRCVACDQISSFLSLASELILGRCWQVTPHPQAGGQRAPLGRALA